jgi:hypothetical protein
MTPPHRARGTDGADRSVVYVVLRSRVPRPGELCEHDTCRPRCGATTPRQRQVAPAENADSSTRWPGHALARADRVASEFHALVLWRGRPALCVMVLSRADVIPGRAGAIAGDAYAAPLQRDESRTPAPRRSLPCSSPNSRHTPTGGARRNASAPVSARCGCVGDAEAMCGVAQKEEVCADAARDFARDDSSAFARRRGRVSLATNRAARVRPVIALMGQGSPLVPRLPRKPVAQRWRREKSSLVDVRHVNIAQTERLGDVTKPV